MHIQEIGDHTQITPPRRESFCNRVTRTIHAMIQRISPFHRHQPIAANRTVERIESSTEIKQPGRFLAIVILSCLLGTMTISNLIMTIEKNRLNEESVMNRNDYFPSATFSARNVCSSFVPNNNCDLLFVVKTPKSPFIKDNIIDSMHFASDQVGRNKHIGLIRVPSYLNLNSTTFFLRQEIEGILAHEISHIVKKHPEQVDYFHGLKIIVSQLASSFFNVDLKLFTEVWKRYEFEADEATLENQQLAKGLLNSLKRMTAYLQVKYPSLLDGNAVHPPVSQRVARLTEGLCRLYPEENRELCRTQDLQYECPKV